MHDVCVELGYRDVKIVSMYINGDARLPIDKGVELADMLGIDLNTLINAAAETYQTNTAWAMIQTIVRRLTPSRPTIEP